jgi:hypothetical protein
MSALSRSLGLLLLLLLLPATPPSRAEVTTDQPGAILVFPKVLVDGTRDTIIQISNASGTQVRLRCFYTTRALDTENREVWLTVDFNISLTRLQPTLWLASTGRPVNPTDRPPELEPGPVPPLASGFVGELRCFAVNNAEQPISRNVLVGNATIADRSTRELRRYAAIAVQGFPKNNNDNTVLLNNVEYSTCPRVLLLNHFFDDAVDPVLESPVHNNITFVPCSVDYEANVPGTASLQFDVVNEFEQRLSASLPVRCFADLRLAAIDSSSDPTRSIFNVAIQGTLVGQTRIRPVPDGDNEHGHGVLAIAEEFHDPPRGGAAANLQLIPGNLQADVMVLPGVF